MFRSFATAATLGLATLAAVAPTGASAAPLATWHGRYVWEENLGRIGGSTPSEGIVAFTTYTLALGPGNGPTQCSLRGEGFQLNEQMQCTATPQGKSVIIKFYKFAANGRGRYRMAAPLFTMTRTGSGIVTRLQALQPSSAATPHSGRLFRRSN